MASNREWRGSLPEWRERVAGWLRRSQPDDLLHVDIFYDLLPVAGNIELGRELHSAAVEAARGSPTFIALLAESVAAMSLPIGMLGRLRTNEGRVDLKLGGAPASPRRHRAHPGPPDRLPGPFHSRAYPGCRRGRARVAVGCRGAGTDPPIPADPRPPAAARRSRERRVPERPHRGGKARTLR